MFGRSFGVLEVLAVLGLSAISWGATYGGGSGTAEDPYQIWTAEQMNTIGINRSDWVKCFILMADIDMSVYTGTQYHIIGTNYNTPFRGTFDGNGHRIINFTYSSPSTECIGLFGCTSGAVIKNVGVENVNLSGGFGAIGGLIGVQLGGTVESSYSTGTINSVPYYKSPVGGLVGCEDLNGLISRCYSTCSLNANFPSTYSSTISAPAPIGGLVGWQYSGVITKSYSGGSIICWASSSSPFFVGGLVGLQEDFGVINHSYSISSIALSSTSTSSNFYAGGLAGFLNGYRGRVDKCYSAGSVFVAESAKGKYAKGGLIGTTSGDVERVTNSFWDVETSGLITSAGGQGCSTIQMKQSGTYFSWNMPEETIWTINEGVDRPQLAWQSKPGTPLSAETINDYLPGSGSQSDPYRVSTPEQFNMIGRFPDQWNKSFCLENDIDLSAFSGTAYNRIGTTLALNFSGSFDGKGYVVRNLNYVTTDGISYVGLFGYTDHAMIQNMSVENIHISAKGSFIGGLVGFQQYGSIMHCKTTGLVACATYYTGGLVGQVSLGTIADCGSEVIVNSSSFAGGLAGKQEKSSIIHSYSTGQVSGSCAGGLVGQQDSGTITNCYSTGYVFSTYCAGGLLGSLNSGTISRSYSSSVVASVLSSAKTNPSVYAGGLVGLQYSGTVITNCYSIGSVDSINTISTSNSYVYAGGLVGYQNGNVNNSYSEASVLAKNNSTVPKSYAYAGGLVGCQSGATIEKSHSCGFVSATGITVYQGGLVGYKGLNAGVVSASFWNIEASGQTTSAAGTGKTTAEMQTLSTFIDAGWDFVGETANGMMDYWRMCADGADYPRLSWEFGRVGDFACPDGVGVEDLEALALKWLTIQGQAGYHSVCDANGDGKIDMADFEVLAKGWMGN